MADDGLRRSLAAASRQYGHDLDSDDYALMALRKGKTA
jgi:hypothetical protein